MTNGFSLEKVLCDECLYKPACTSFMDKLDENGNCVVFMPKSEVEVIQRAKWIETKNGFHCSNCKKKPGQHPTKRGAFLSNRCPHCGAIMDD